MNYLYSIWIDSNKGVGILESNFQFMQFVFIGSMQCWNWKLFVFLTPWITILVKFTMIILHLFFIISTNHEIESRCNQMQYIFRMKKKIKKTDQMKLTKKLSFLTGDDEARAHWKRMWSTNSWFWCWPIFVKNSILKLNYFLALYHSWNQYVIFKFMFSNLKIN